MLEHRSTPKVYRFDQLAELITERVHPNRANVDRYVGLEHLDSDSLRIRRWGDPSEVDSTKFGFEANDIIFGKRRVYQRKLAVADTEGICSAHAMVLRAKTDAVLPELLPYFMQSDVFMERALSISVGSLSPTINWKALAKEEFVFPQIQDQSPIVEVLSAHRTALERIENAEDALVRTREAFVEDLLVRKYSAAPMVRISSLLMEGPRNGKTPPVTDSESGFPTVSTSAVSNGIFDPEGCVKFVDIDPVDAAHFLVHKGDAFAVRGNGNRNLMGKVGLCTKGYGDLIYPDLLILLRFDESVILKEFAVAQWNHPSVHARLASRAKPSSGVWNINGQDIREHTLKVPHIDDQRDAAAVLSHFLSQALSMQKRRRELLGLQKKLHDQAFG